MAIDRELMSEIDDLKEQLIKKDKIILALKNRVKQSIQKSGDAYAIFERNIVLQGLVEEQTKGLHAAAHKADVGDLLIIAAYAQYDEQELQDYAPKLCYVDDNNTLVRTDSKIR